MDPFLRNYQKLKTLDDYFSTDAPGIMHEESLTPTTDEQMVLRMLVRPKYGGFKIPPELDWLYNSILRLAVHDEHLTKINASWCYVTVRHGPVTTKTDDEWHFDGSSFRTDIIPERNYVWVNHTPLHFKLGWLNFPDDFDPLRHNLFHFAASQLKDAPYREGASGRWMLINPFCLHRRSPRVEGNRTFVRVCFTDIEGRDVNNTANPLLATPAYGRDPVRSFRDRLKTYGHSS